MKKVFLTLTMLLFAFMGTTRAYEVQIGEGTSTTDYFPFYTLYNHSISECLFLASELTDAGMEAGPITSLSWYANNAPGYAQQGLSMWIANVTDEELTTTSHVSTDMTLVYTGSCTPAIGWNEFEFNEGTFSWDGTSNLLILFNRANGDWNTTVNWQYTATEFKSVAYRYQDSGAYDPTVANTMYTGTNRPNIVIKGQAGGGGGEGGSLTVHDGQTTNSFVPVYGFYADAYNKCEMVYPAAELSVMTGTNINTMTFYADNTNVSWGAAEFQVFVAEVADATISAFAGPGTVVYEGALSIVDGQMIVNFDTPYTYNGGNLLVGVYQTVQGSYVSATWLGEGVTGASISGYSYSGLDACSPGSRHFLPKTTFDYTVPGEDPKAFATVPEVLDLGFRPNGAWMAPYVFNLKSNVGAVTVNTLDFSGNYFTATAELPATVSGNNPLEVAVSTGTADEGEVNSTITILYSGNNRDSEQLEITAHAYDPVEGDVFEQAIAVPALAAQTPYNTQFPAGMYKNYELPVETQANDAVYALNFTQDVLLYAGAEQGNVVLYTNDFNGEDGPMADNNYEYNGPTINPGPVSMWFSYSYTGSNTFFGTEVGGGMIFGYRITPAQLQELGLGACAITTVEAAAREGSYYDLMILKGGETPDLDNMVYYQSFEDFEPYYFFDVNLDEPQFLGDDENLWIMFYTDSPYAAYCGRQPVDAANSKIWYTTNLSTWYSNTAYTPMIYTRFLELPTGREVTVNLADMKIRESKPAEGQIAEANGDVMGVSKAQIAQNNRGNRDDQTLTVYEGTATNNTVPMYVFYFDDFTRSQYIMPASELTDMVGGQIKSIKYYTGATNIPYTTASNFNIYLKEVAETTLSAYVETSTATTVYQGTGEFVAEGDGGSITITFNAPFTYNGGNLLIGCENTTDAGYKNISFYGESGHSGAAASGYNSSSTTAASFNARDFLPKTTFTYTPASTPEPPTPSYEPYVPGFATMIDGMYVPAGTYYLVAASDIEEAVLSFAIADVPAPEPSIVIAPYDGEPNVTAPYLAEWTLGDYTEEMQVLLGTQYPPQTALIDWTDYLVESAFIMDLEPNQSYFMQVNERNAAGTTMGEIVAFTTPIDPVEGFTVENDQLYPGEAAVFTWEANRTLIGYNIYKDGVKVNETPITENTYPYEGLEYNMPLGSEFTLTAVYAAGESEPSEPITVYMTGTGIISGYVYDAPEYDPENPDQSHPVAGIPVSMIVLDEYEQTQYFEYVTDENGFYMGEVLAGMNIVGISQENGMQYGYATAIYYDEMGIPYVMVANEGVYENIDIYTHEYYYPLSMITATEEENDVLVEWSWTPAEMIVDFETGDFSQADFTLPAQYPWTITTTNPHEGTYCMKSTCEGIASGVSSIEATVEVPYYAKMGFWVKVSSETNYDKFHFYIDGVEQGQALSGALEYQYKEYTVEEGTHTYKWEYAKDSSVNSNDDCVYVDDITMYMQDVPPQPIPGATVYNFDDDTMMGWTSVDADGDGNGWVSSANPGIYHNAGVSLSGTGHNASEAYVISGSYANQTGQALTPDNYLVSPTAISAQAGAAIEFYACAQDASYAAEHFGVAVSTTTPTAGAFTTIQEWTMTAKSMGTVDMRSDVRGTRQGTWYMYTVDLSAYAGQDIWVAIRHFNCTDMFILNVDDITLGDGSAKGFDRAGDRSLVSYNLYRRNNLDTLDASYAPTLLASNIATDVMSYIDAEWPNLPYGEYQWGIQAAYEGYAPEPERSRETATFGFEGGLEGWTGIVVNTDGGEWIHSDDNLGGYDYSELAHTGTGFAMCYSFVDYVGSFDTDAYLVSPQKYSVDANSSISFWADNANDSYPESFSVCVSTAANPTASDFTQVWSGGAKGTGNGGAAVRRSENRYENWRSHEISLADYAGQEIWIAFHDVNYDMYEIWIDDVTINYAGGAPVPPTPPTPEGALSDIIWSNVLDKDMISTVTFNVALNNSQSPEGAVIELEALANEYEFTVGETGTITEEIRKGEYVLNIELDGYEPVEDVVLNITADAEEFSYILTEIIAPVADFYVSPTGWAMWEGGTVGPTPGPTPPTPPTGILFEDDFEDGAITNWTTVDADGDGDTWQNATPASYGIGNAHSGTNCASSWSWNSVTMYPDNWMISPMVDGATSIQYYVATNTAYPDHYGIYASSTGTNTSDFTLVFEETAGSKGGNGVKSSMTQGSSREMSAWMEKNIELPAGTKYVAFRHWNSDDMNYLFIDDVTIEGAGRGDRVALSYKVFLEGDFVGETVYPFYQIPVEGLVEGETYTVGVAPLYATGMAEMMYATFTYAACNNYNGATNYAAAVNGNDVTLTWTLPGGGVTPPGGGDTFEEGFEGGMPEGWTVVDANNDGYTWCLTSAIPSTWTYYASLTLDWYRTGTNAICSGSYINGAGALNPDEYLVMGQQNIVNGSTLSFWAAATDASYPADHFGVAVSDDATTWTMVQEWTLTGKKGANGGRESRDGKGAKLGTWYNYTVDLSAYAGQKYIAIRHFNCYDMYIMCVDDIELAIANKGGNRAMWDLVGSFQGTSAGQQAVATDGNYIYTASWQSTPTGGHTFYQYDLEGNFIEGFDITGATGIRDLTTDGEYFYGTSGGAQIFILDFTTRTLVGTINCSGLTSRHISYDPERDGFWSGNWSTLALYSRTGALIQNGPAPTSAYGSAYYKDADGVEHLFLFCQPNSDCMVYDYNITTGTLGSNVVLDFSSTTPGCTGIAGGSFIGNYGDKLCWFGNSQQDPNLIGIYELESNPGPGPGPQPTPGEVLGVMIWRDGQPLTLAPLNASTYTDENVEAGTHDYCIRVVYSDYAMACAQCETVEVGDTPVTCDPVTNLTAEPYTYNGNDGALIQFTEPVGATSYKVYVDGQLLGSIAAQPIFINFEGSGDGNYEIGIVAVYAECESDMATVMFTWDSVNETEIVNAIYPNPTSDNLHINATAMTHVSVYNAMGQMVLDQEVSGDEVVLNMGQFEAGVYMVKVTTEAGSSVKRINVVK
jgi:hypothetical protein